LIWDRFKQADSSTTRAHGGLGLGLAIVRSLVELHDGQVSAHSAGPGQGSTFRVELPSLATKPQTTDSQTTHSQTTSVTPHTRFAPTPVDTPSTLDRTNNEIQLAPQAGNQETGKPETIKEDQSTLDENSLQDLRILVVEDEPDSRHLIAMVLEGQGAVVKTAASAAEALEVARDWQPQLLVSDIGMPQMDGYQLLRALRSEWHAAYPALALTAYATSEDRQQALEAGFQQHLPKPVDPEELVSTVQKLMQENVPQNTV
jgi:CheY-like chemotaxis protein